jgi:hypothetical protein
MEEAHAKKAEA